MPEIEVGPDMIQIDAGIVAQALKLTPRDLQRRMREGAVTSRFERGEGADAGRMRLTFFSDSRRARITADVTGQVLSCTAVDYVAPPKGTPPTSKSTQTNHPVGATGHEPDHARLDALLDAALDGTFPASDPIAIAFDPRDRDGP